MIDAGRFGAEREFAEAQRVEESRCLSREDLVNTGNDCGGENGLVDDPEFEKESVEPFGGFKVCLEPSFVCLSIDVIPNSSADSLDAGPVICGGYCQHKHYPGKSGPEAAEDPADEAAKEDYAGVMPP